MFKWIRRLALILGVMAAIPTLYYLAAFAGALTWPRAQELAASGREQVEIYLLATFLHADLALPVDNELIEDFGFVRASGVPLDHQDLRYLVIGWGSRDFYTTAGSYADIRPAAVLKAVTGDASVMHVYPTRDIAATPGARKITLAREDYRRLVAHVIAGFRRNAAGQAVLVDGATFGEGDLFYEANGRFNIFTPCNIWVAEGLRNAGIGLGPWTPTSQSLRFSLWLSGH